MTVRDGLTDSMLGWHWLAADRRLRFGSRETVELGRIYTAKGPLVLCKNGMHACRRALDSLTYARGPLVCRVRLFGELQHDTDKSVARHRTVLWMADATALLHEFALVCAEEALGQEAAVGREPDARSWAALETKRLWLRGAATDQERATAEAAAWAAAGAATEAATEATAEAAAEAAAGAATEAAIGAAAWAAAGADKNKVLEQMLASLAAERRKP